MHSRLAPNLQAKREAEASAGGRLMILDVGCGHETKWHRHIEGENIIHVDIDKKAVNLHIQCDIYNLPFPDDSISVVYASHILEHLEHPLAALKEMKRIAQNLVIVKVPNASFWKFRPSGKKDHLFSWNEWTLRCFLNYIFDSVQITKTVKWEIFGNWRFPKLQKLKRMIERGLFGRSELTAICKKESACMH